MIVDLLCIDWSIPACSIFATRDGAKAWAKEHGVGVPVRPLAEATQARIAEGIRRYVLTSPSPFIVSGPGAPIVVNTRNGERAGQAPRVRGANEPLLTITSQGSQGAVATAWLAKHYGGVVGHEVTRPLGTVTAVDHHSVVAAHMLNLSHGGRHEGVDDPMRTITATPKGGDRAIVAAHLTKFHGTSTGSSLSDPLGTVTGQGLHHGLVTAELGDPGGQRMTVRHEVLPGHP